MAARSISVFFFIVFGIVSPVPIRAISLATCVPAWEGQKLCARVDVDYLALTADGTQTDLAQAIIANVSLSNTLMAPVNASCGSTALVNVSTLGAVLSVSLQLGAGSTVNVSFAFHDSSLYNATTGHLLCPGASQQLTSLTVSAALQGHAYAPATFPTSPVWSYGAGASFNCSGFSFLFNASQTFVLNATNVRAQAFMVNASSFAPMDANSYCPAPPAADSPSSNSKAGLIVGGIISGLAVLGIAVFTYSKCRTKNNYELLYNNSSSH